MFDCQRVGEGWERSSTARWSPTPSMKRLGRSEATSANGASAGLSWSWWIDEAKLVGGLEHFSFVPYIGNNHPNWPIFSEGLKPPTRKLPWHGDMVERIMNDGARIKWADDKAWQIQRVQRVGIRSPNGSIVLGKRHSENYEAKNQVLRLSQRLPLRRAGLICTMLQGDLTILEVTISKWLNHMEPSY